MPSPNTIRNFTENGIYHVYNRGVEKRNIFFGVKDYKMFLYYVFIYLAPPHVVQRRYPTLPIRLQSKNLHTEVKLLAFCLMTNHFHFLIQDISGRGISKAMKQIMNAYTAYFNKRYDRVGHLMQGVFKAAEITTDEQLVQVCRYIHLNPLIAGLVTNLQEYRWSNYIQYVDNKDGAFCDKDIILSLFPSSKAYEQFTLDQIDYQKNLDYIDALILD